MNTSMNDMLGKQRQRVRTYGLALNTRRQWYADNDTATPDTENDSGGDDGQKDGADGDQNNGNQGERKYTQAEMDKAIEGRVAREKRKNKEAADKVAADAEKGRLQKAGEFEALNTTLNADVERLTGELETAGANHTTQTEELDRYKALIQTQVEKLSEGVPDHVKTLLADKQPAEQLAWLAENGEAVNQTAQLGTPGAGQRGNGKQNKGDEKAKAKAVKNLIPRM